MKTPSKLLWRGVVLVGCVSALAGCFTDGYIGMSNGVYYGPHRDPWFHDDPWMDGHHWYRGPHVETSIGIYLHPPHGRR